MRRVTSVGQGNRSVHHFTSRSSIGRGKRRRLARRRGVSVESLESRTLLATWTALPVADGATNSLRYYVDKANTTPESDTINLKAARYELDIDNVAGVQENANQTGD